MGKMTTESSFRWEWDGNGNKTTELGGIWCEKSVPAHLYYKAQHHWTDCDLAH